MQSDQDAFKAICPHSKENETVIQGQGEKITVLDAIHMAVEAWGKVKQSAIRNCFKKCLLDQSVQIDPIEVPEGYSREAWENQIDLESKVGLS